MSLYFHSKLHCNWESNSRSPSRLIQPLNHKYTQETQNIKQWQSNKVKGKRVACICSWNLQRQFTKSCFLTKKMQTRAGSGFRVWRGQGVDTRILWMSSCLLGLQSHPLPFWSFIKVSNQLWSKNNKCK